MAAERLDAPAHARDAVALGVSCGVEAAPVVGHAQAETAAVDLELDPQVWSLNQPAFAERLAALQRRITSRG